MERASWIGFTLARQAQGAEIDEIDIFGLATGTNLAGRRPIAFAGEELSALRAWQHDVTKPSAAHWRELIPVSLDLPSGWGDRPAILRALELTAQHARADHATAPWLGTPALLKALGVTRTPLPCLVIADKALRLAPRDRDAIVPRHLKAMTRAAELGLARLDGIETERLGAAHAIARARRPGKLIDLVALLERRAMLTPLAVARMFGLTISGAGKLLSRAASEGIAVEISGRQAWRAYLAPDLAIAFGFKHRPAGRPAKLPTPGPLDATLAAFDAEMAAFALRYPGLVNGDLPEDTDA